MDKRIKDLEDLVKNLLTIKIEELEVKEKDSEAKIDILVKQMKLNEEKSRSKENSKSDRDTFETKQKQY